MRTVALVGYTNAGKSTLFNRLTARERVRRRTSFSRRSTRRCGGCTSQARRTIVLSDTVGFIRELPHDLVAAFRATLAEAADADLLLHVIDAAADNRDEQIEAVDALLAEIGAGDVPQIRVLNKSDVTGMPAGVERDACGTHRVGPRERRDRRRPPRIARRAGRAFSALASSCIRNYGHAGVLRLGFPRLRPEPFLLMRVKRAASICR